MIYKEKHLKDIQELLMLYEMSIVSGINCFDHGYDICKNLLCGCSCLLYDCILDTITPRVEFLTWTEGSRINKNVGKIRLRYNEICSLIEDKGFIVDRLKLS